MPRIKKAWSSWNFLGASGAESDEGAVCVTYWLNKLQVGAKRSAGGREYGIGRGVQGLGRSV